MIDLEFEPEEEMFLSQLKEEMEDISNPDYAIYVSVDGDPWDSLDVSSRFDTPEMLDDVGITTDQRSVVAHTKIGYNFLSVNGFNDYEIIKEYTTYEDEDSNFED